jgi:hypothetical protein
MTFLAGVVLGVVITLAVLLGVFYWASRGDGGR